MRMVAYDFLQVLGCIFVEKMHCIEKIMQIFLWRILEFYANNFIHIQYIIEQFFIYISFIYRMEIPSHINQKRDQAFLSTLKYFDYIYLASSKSKYTKNQINKIIFA